MHDIRWIQYIAENGRTLGDPEKMYLSRIWAVGDWLIRDGRYFSVVNTEIRDKTLTVTIRACTLEDARKKTGQWMYPWM